LTLNGMPTPFVLTVTLNFSLKQARPINVGWLYERSRD